MGAKDFAALIHPMLAVAIVFPLIGMVVRLSVLTRQRRLEVSNKQKSKIAQRPAQIIYNSDVGSRHGWSAIR